MAKFLPKQVYFSPKKRTKKILNKRPEVLLDQLALYKRFADARGSNCETNAVTPEMLLDNFKKIIIEDGITVIKHGRQGDPHTRILHLVEKTMELAWQQPNGEHGHMKGGPLFLHDCWCVRRGIELDPWTRNSPEYEVPLLGTAVLRESCSPDNAPLALSLLWNHRTVDIQVESRSLCEYLQFCFETLRKFAKQQEALRTLQTLVPKPDDNSPRTELEEEDLLKRIKATSQVIEDYEDQIKDPAKQLEFVHEKRRMSEVFEEDDFDEDDDEGDSEVNTADDKGRNRLHAAAGRGQPRGNRDVLLSIDD